ncbi:hypothetical protein B0T22DRAFT_370197 [Podospora appendiculata]|uniref:Zn(2)-C6 fungal-type domain-containing protein n=1 Tax=Podospora appendiculata TaxID=314037 RepID=A0AAE0XKH5_9PEZI|nr:hypothetical protein B0T22DRAFT_370197 [Podospora appendiculata]
MSNDPTVRRLLPQSSQMGAFSFAPPAYQQPRESQKNYVFVDEHNRHKRLKVMRACEGCRRRKIKCDAATTNTWPCSACVRLKLHCVRPNGYDGSTEPQVYEPPPSQFDSPHEQDGYRQQLPLPDQQLIAHAPKPASIYAQQSSYQDPSGLYHSVQYTDPRTAPHNLQYASVHHPSVSAVDQAYATQQSFPTPPMQQGSHHSSSPDAYHSDQYAQQDLADLLGSLKVNEAGTAPYLNSKLRPKEDEEPAVEDADDYKSLLPPLTSGPGSKIRIPPELMPDEDTILHYFNLYFTHAHPYVPVLDKAHFYQQWHNNRNAVSPLLLEAIFAIAGRLADEPGEGQQWLALATRHADSFMDVPRLSTLQALMIILKAREQAPKRGYYYRSWMSIVQCVQVAKDLGLDEHFSDHQAGRSCSSGPSECLLKNRIWQTIFACEVMIGSPQGRTDLQVEEESVDFSVPRPIRNGDESEYHVSRNFTYFALVVRNVSRMGRAYGRLKKVKEWGIDPEFVQIKPNLDAWFAQLPADLTISYPADGSAPWLPSAFVGNLHSYYYLSIILFHRPQLAFTTPGGVDGQWKEHMLVSYDAAKMLCRLQESVVSSFGILGLQCMQRGINFTIYAVLGCIVLHLVALTSPDPDLNSEAREYFTRHMRLLEKCMGTWPMPDMQRQVDSVREAFSADTRKPFVLKPSFPYGSPQPSTHSSPPGPAYRTGSMGHNIDTQVQHSHVSYTSHPISPPISAGPLDTKSDSPGVQSLAMMASGHGTQPSSVQQTLPLAEPPAWNPSRIFDQWNTSFGTPPPAQPPPASMASQASSLSVASSGASEASSIQDIQAVHAQLPPGSQLPPQQYSATPVQTFVTPAMWQESVASVYEGGLKRSWDYDPGHMSVKRR